VLRAALVLSCIICCTAIFTRLSSLSYRRWGMGGTDDQHWARRETDNTFRDTAQQHMAQACAPVGAHNDQVSMGRRGPFQ
jgi:hypothetical protein